ncbi:MAG: hypothetical protein GXO39_03000 [Thermotogae bacterium]|nr:hypothetical protein [Thermotogota bacterium]
MKGWWILTDKDGLVVESGGTPDIDVEYFGAVITFGTVGLQKAIGDELNSRIGEISFNVPDRHLVFHVLPVEEESLYLITAMPDSLPLGMIRLKTREIYDAVLERLKKMKPEGLE